MSELTAAPAVVTRELTKRYGPRAALDGLTMTVPCGSICGFVGPNGSGKTTTIRILLGLVRPGSGSASVLGGGIRDPGAYLPRIGALIEGPAFYPTLSGRKNLEVLAHLGGIGVSNLPNLLDSVGLGERSDDKVRTYSLGMKQRLGIAMALLIDPDLLILDEPMNGLDPPGMLEVRELVRTLQSRGKTVFISSHLLGEVEQVADWLVVLKEGRAVFCGPANAIGAGQTGLTVVPEEAAQLEILARLVRGAGYTCRVEAGTLRIASPESFAGELNRLASNAGVTIVELHRTKATLESTFFEVIGEPR